MANDYLIVLSGNNVFREIELDSSSQGVRIGTEPRCEVRFRRELFFANFELEVAGKDDQWSVAVVQGDVYLSTDDVMRRMFAQLEHGTRIDVRYASTGATLFSLTFAINFERERGEYDRVVDLTGLSQITLGGREECNLRLNGAYTTGDMLVISRTAQGFMLTEQGTRFGAFVNGRQFSGSVPLPDKTFFSVANFYFYYDAEQLRCSSKESIRFAGVAYKDEEPRCATSVYPLFNRNTRIKSVMDNQKIPILDPPNPPNPPQGNIVLQLLPALLMMGLSVGMRSVLGSGSNSAYMIMMAVMMSVGIVTSAISIISERRAYKRNVAMRIDKYNAYIGSKRDDVQRYRAEELDVLNKRYPSLGEEMRMVQDFSGDLFDRTVADDDFLDVRLGLGPRRSVKQLDYKEREKLESDPLAELPRQVYLEFEYLPNAPVSVSFAECGGLGVVGNDQQLYSTLKNMVVDIATRHFPTDVKIFFIVQPQNVRYIHWARNLPHVQNEELNRRNIVCDEESRNVLFEYLYKELAERESLGDKVKPLPRFVIFVVDEWGLKNHPLSRFIDNAEHLGTTFVFLEGYRELLPLGCDNVVTLEGSTGGVVVSSSNERLRSSFSYDTVDDYAAWMMAQTLAPVYSEEVSLEGSLTTSYSLFEMLNIISADDLDFASRWRNSVVYRSIAAPIGMSKAGVVELDLSDRADGPHGLVAGTTGSGKSETLLTYLVSVATLFHPHEVAFMVIDFKGGGMANELRDLPHLIGTITNIDGREIDRSLKSIRAELQKRQRYFAEADVNHIDAYIRKYKAGQVKNPLPHLIIVVDEFAELKADQPEFMAELISAARIGRSLGVHLILATQKPAGQVNEQIWSNSRFKLCLKVQSREDSNEVLKSPLAAEIKEPGRAYLQVGNNEKFELFQSAYSGGPEHQDDEDVHEYTIYQVENSGKRVPIYRRKRAKSDNEHITQLDAVVGEIGKYCQRAGVVKLPSICLPSLEDVITFPKGGARIDNKMALGIYDDPDSQYQGPATFDLTNANTFVVGSSQMGKTNLLEVMMRAIAESYSPRQAIMYVMDFSSMILRNFETLHHVGGVVISSEEERIKNLFKLLQEEIAQRKRRLLDVGVSSFQAYLEAGYSDLPHIYLFMDNFSVFRELYLERHEQELLNVCSEGLSYGISVIIANPSTQGFGYKYLSNFSNHIALTCNDATEYGALFERCRMEPKGVPGRALCKFDRDVYEFQTYLCFEGEKEIDRVREMRAFVQRQNALYPNDIAQPIPSVPDDLTQEFVISTYEPTLELVPMGMSYANVEPVYVDLSEQYCLGLVGDREGMRKDFVHTFLHDLIEGDRALDRLVDLYLVDSYQRELAEYAESPYTVRYSGDHNEIVSVVEEVKSVFDDRQARLRSDGFQSISADPYTVVIVNSVDAIKSLSGNREALAAYEDMASQARGMRTFFLFAEVPNEAVGYSGPAILKSLRDNGKTISLVNLPELKFQDVPANVRRAFPSPLEPGQAYAMYESGIEKVRIAQVEAVTTNS